MATGYNKTTGQVVNVPDQTASNGSAAATTASGTATTTTAKTPTTWEQMNEREKKSKANINSTYDSNLNAQNAALQSAYNANVQAQQEAAQGVQKAANAAAYDVGVQNARNTANLDRFADVRGVNRQAGSQQALNLGAVRNAAEATIAYQQQQALAENQRQQELAKVNYQNEMTKALADNDYKRAAALLDDYKNQQTWRDQQAEILASYGNFDPYGELYGTDAANTMKSVWMAQNPDVAYRTGAIDAETYKNITGQYPKGYTPPLVFDTSWYTGYVPDKTKGGGNDNKGAITPEGNGGSTGGGSTGWNSWGLKFMPAGWGNTGNRGSITSTTGKVKK